MEIEYEIGFERDNLGIDFFDFCYLYYHLLEDITGDIFYLDSTPSTYLRNRSSDMLWLFFVLYIIIIKIMRNKSTRFIASLIIVVLESLIEYIESLF